MLAHRLEEGYNVHTVTESQPESIVLRDGRVLAYARYGAPAGVPVFYFHGWPGSRVEARLFDVIARRDGIRLIAIDRPGYGGSDFEPERTLLDWPEDVAALADALGIDRFGVLGVSGGGPYVAATTVRLRDRLHCACIVCGLGPLDEEAALEGMLAHNRLGLLAARRAPWLAVPILSMVAPIARRAPGRLVDRLVRRATKPDQRFFENPEHRAAFQDTFREAFRQGSRGPAWDVRLYARPWGFDLADVGVAVDLWHGGDDVVVPIAMGRVVAQRMPLSRPRFHDADGHFSVVADRVEDIFRTLAVVS